MVGRKFVARVLADGTLGGQGVSHLTLQDVVEPHRPADAHGIGITTPTATFRTRGRRSG